MKYLALLLAGVIVAWAILGGGVYGQAGTSTDRGNFSSSGNFTVNLNGSELVIFRYINVSGMPHQVSNIHRGGLENNGFYWQGHGNVTLVPGVNYSRENSLNSQDGLLNFIYLYTNEYLGVLLSNGNVILSRGTIEVTSPGGVVFVEYLTAPFSAYGMKFLTYSETDGEFHGENSAFSIENGTLSSYSLLKENTSLDVIKNVSGEPGGIQVATNTSTLINAPESLVIPSDLNLPTILLSILGPGVAVNFDSYVNLSPLAHSRVDNKPFQDQPIQNLPRASEYLISIQKKTIGFAIVYGSSEISRNSLMIDGPISFAVIRFLNPSHSEPLINNANATNGVEVVISKGAYYIPLSPNISLDQISFSHGNLFLSISQNGTSYIFIVLEGNLSFGKSEIVTPAGSFNYTSLKKEGNFTMVTFVANGTGMTNLSLSVLPVSGHQIISAYYLVVFASALTAITLSVIYLSRRRWIRSFEKE
ncbi:MAG: hypothetical protein QXW75_03030 [Thermoplasmatales archaeon]